MKIGGRSLTGVSGNRGGLAFTMAASVTLAMALAGCVNLGAGKAPPRLFTLTPEATAPAGASVTAKKADSIQVAEPVTPRELAVARVPVTMDGDAITYLKDAYWVERPSRLFRSLLAEALRAKGGHLVMEDDQNEAGAGISLSGRLDRLGYDARSHSVVVRYDALRTAADGTVSSRRFEAVEEHVAPTADAVTSALNRAANQLARAVADWLG